MRTMQPSVWLRCTYMKRAGRKVRRLQRIKEDGVNGMKVSLAIGVLVFPIELHEEKRHCQHGPKEEMEWNGNWHIIAHIKNYLDEYCQKRRNVYNQTNRISFTYFHDLIIFSAAKIHNNMDNTITLTLKIIDQAGEVHAKAFKLILGNLLGVPQNDDTTRNRISAATLQYLTISTI